MKNVIRTVSGLAACVVGVLLSASHVSADFELEIDGTTLREISNGSYEIDAFFKLTPNPAAPTVHSLLLNMVIAPANGYSLSAISGVKFDGLRNPDSNQLFPSPTVSQQFFGPLQMRGGVTNTTPVAIPASSRLAFTVLFSTSNGTAADVEIKFEEPGNFYMVDRDNEGLVYNYNNLFSSPPITVVKVPEPGTCLLAALALGGIGMARRFSTRRRLGSARELIQPEN